MSGLRFERGLNRLSCTEVVASCQIAKRGQRGGSAAKAGTSRPVEASFGTMSRPHSFSVNGRRSCDSTELEEFPSGDGGRRRVRAGCVVVAEAMAE